MKDLDIKKNIAKLENMYGTYRAKCLRNLRMYTWSPTQSLTNYTDAQVVGFYQRGTFDIESDTTTSIQMNVIASCIDTLTSKIASQKARCFINTINGSFKQMQVAKAGQQFFDNMYDELNINKTITRAFKDACVFDRGIVFVDNATKNVERVLPWQLFVDPREMTYGNITRAAWKREAYPTTLLKTKSKEDTVTLYEYWDIINEVHAQFILETNEIKVEKWDKGVIPFLFINYSEPLKGCSSQSVVDLLYGIQMDIDAVLTKMKDASQLSNPLKFIVPDTDTIKVNKLSNRVGDVITYTPIPGQTTVPVSTVTDPIMDPSWRDWIDKLKQDAYELVGISQLSATSQKPKGLDSGVALSTMEDIESDRFETQLNNVIRLYTDIARMCLKVFDAEEDILPQTKLRQSLKWSDLVEAQKDLQIQFSAAESLSKDPSTKLTQLQALRDLGLIPASRVAQLMELPDLQAGYSFSNNALNAVLSVIDSCLENDDYNVPDYIPLRMLKEEIINTCLSLRAANYEVNKADIDKLQRLYVIADDKDIESQTSAEMAAVSSLGAELQQQMPQMQQQISNMVQQQLNTENMMLTENIGEQ